ncbi:MAG: response regulator, partial [Myxococcota bacterium]
MGLHLGRPTLVVVDDDVGARDEIVRSADGWSVLHAASADEAESLISQKSIQLIFAGSLGGSAGVDLLRRIRRNQPQVRRVLLWSDTDPDTLFAAINAAEVFRIVRKPSSQEEIRAVLQAALAHASEIEAEVDRRTETVTRGKREWEDTFDAIRMPITIVGPDFSVVRANRACADLRGEDIRQIPGQKCYAALFARSEPCEPCAIRKLDQEGGSSTQAEINALGRDFRAVAYRMKSKDSVVCSYQDITEEKRRVAHQAHTEKMVALGQLAGSVAHEINNPIAT